MGIVKLREGFSQSVMLQYLIATKIIIIQVTIKIIIIQVKCVMASGAKSGYLTDDKLACFDATGMNTYLV